jgi:hypothetical protein
VELDGSRREADRTLTLERIAFGSKDACNNAISIEAADGFAQEILEPIHIKLKRNPEGGFTSIQIDGETGTAILTKRIHGPLLPAACLRAGP